MPERYIFHLSFPVSDLPTCKTFYVDALGAKIGRENTDLWGHQITLQRCPDETLPKERQSTRHFGAILPWTEWQRLVEQLRNKGIRFLDEPTVTLAGTPQVQAKLYLEDPSNNVIEIKAYRDIATTLQADDTYSYE